MRQPTKKERSEGFMFGYDQQAWDVPYKSRALTPGDKPGEMVLSRAENPMSNKNRTRIQVTSDVEGGRGKTNPPRVKPTASKGQIHSATNKAKIAKAVQRADERSVKANRDTIKKNETFGQYGKRKKEREDIDTGYKTVTLKHGSAGRGGTYSPTKEEIKSEFLDSLKPKPKPKPKEEKKMGGGKVYKYGHGGGLGKTGKVIKTNMTGEQLVAACYGNKSV